MAEDEVSRWGRIVFTRPEVPEVPPAGRVIPAGPAAAPDFGPEFDHYLQIMYARAQKQAVELVDYVDPVPGSVVVEVGAGAGRIAFDGKVAERVGPSGQLLLTDVSSSRLDACIDRARRHQTPWVRVLRADAESVPIASDTADLVLAVSVLHFTDLERSIPELARITKSGGRVAISTGLDFVWSPLWWEALAPIRAALARYGRFYEPYLPTSHELHGRLERAGLQVLKYRAWVQEVLDFPSVDLAVGFWRQIGLVPLVMRGVPVEEYEAVQDAVDERTRALFPGSQPEQWRLHLTLLDIIAGKP